MRIGIIVAMRKELDLLLPLLHNSEESRMGGMEFHRGTIGVHDVMVMQCGIGKVNAAMGALMLVNHFAPHYVINSGVAGGADLSVHVMDVVAGARVAYHDVWCGPDKGLICSGDWFVDKKEDVNRIKGSFADALAVDMESGAIAQVCHLCKVPFLALRVISDSPGASHDNTRQYLDFWTDAPRETFKLVQEIINNL